MTENQHKSWSRISDNKSTNWEADTALSGKREKMSYSIKEVSERFQLSPYTLRYYEKEGLLPHVSRDSNGVRVYNETDLEWLQLICCMRTTGMSISYIKNYVELCRQGNDTIPERRQIILNQKEIVQSELKKYKQLLKAVNHKLQYYDEKIIQADNFSSLNHCADNSSNINPCLICRDDDQ